MLSIRPEPGELVALDADTVMSAGSAEAALRAAGGAVHGGGRGDGGLGAAAFVAIRPPGHHAEPARPMGFCLFNNAAVAAGTPRRSWGLRRVAVVDFDVHHGNGTQAMFGADPDLFYASATSIPAIPAPAVRPNTGWPAISSMPRWRPGATGAAFRVAWESTILPALDAFAPELLIVSAGFDAHKADPLAQLGWKRPTSPG